jgi:hypothetical protein
MSFLASRNPVPLTLPPGLDWSPVGVYLGKGGGNMLEIAVVKCLSRPAKSDLRAAWKFRRKTRASPLLLIALHGDKASLIGYTSDHLSAWHDLDIQTVERIALAALDALDRHAAIRLLCNTLPRFASDLGRRPHICLSKTICALPAYNSLGAANIYLAGKPV